MFFCSSHYFPTWVDGISAAILSAAPRRGERRVRILGHTLSHIRLTFTLNIQTEYSHVAFPGGPPMPPTPPKWREVISSKSHQKLRPQNNNMFLQKSSPWDAILHPKITKICKSDSPMRTCYFLWFFVWKCYDFLTPWNLEHGALVYTNTYSHFFTPPPKCHQNECRKRSI